METHSSILAGEFQGQRSLARYSPRGCKESDMTERISLSLSLNIYVLRSVAHHVWLSATPWNISARLLCPWNFPGENTGVGFHFLLQEIFLIQGLNPSLLCLLCWQADSLPLWHLEAHCEYIYIYICMCVSIYMCVYIYIYVELSCDSRLS